MPSLTPLIAPGADPVDPNSDSGAQRRLDARSNIFVVAALASAGGSWPVRIRNMSRSGALIEGAVLPPEGTPLRLSRGSLSVTGEIVWRRENKAGVRFDSAVAVADWLPGGNRATGQQRVDEIVYSVKAEIGALRQSAAPAHPSVPERTDIAGELLELKASLATAAEELADDEAAAERHPGALQAIDMAGQKLEKLARLFGAGAA